MSARSTAVQLAIKASIVFGALFVVSVLLAAMPGHHPPTVGLDGHSRREHEFRDATARSGSRQHAGNENAR